MAATTLVHLLDDSQPTLPTLKTSLTATSMISPTTTKQYQPPYAQLVKDLNIAHSQINDQKISQQMITALSTSFNTLKQQLTQFASQPTIPFLQNHIQTLNQDILQKESALKELRASFIDLQEQQGIDNAKFSTVQTELQVTKSELEKEKHHSEQHQKAFATLNKSFYALDQQLQQKTQQIQDAECKHGTTTIQLHPPS